MQLADLIEKRRFVGREFLLLLWMESELFEGTLATREHGSFGLWIEKKLVISAETESTNVTAALPGLGRQAKEALLRGQLPESAGLRIAWNEHETSLALAGETFAMRGLKLQTELGGEGDIVMGDLVDEIAGRSRRPKKARSAEDDEDDDSSFYERMKMAREIEDLFAALYREFLELRLSRRWSGVVVPTMLRWAEGQPIDADAYRAARNGKTRNGKTTAKKPSANMTSSRRV